MDILRAFFAIDLSETLRDTLVETIKPLHLRQDISICWSPPEDWHITLQFIRAFAREDLSSLIENVRQEIKKTTSFTVKLHEIELFPSPRYPRALAISFQPNQALTTLSKQIGRGICTTNYAIEKRPYRGHITLGKFNKRPPENFSSPPSASIAHLNVPITKVIFYESRPRSCAPHYMPLDEMLL